MKIKLVILGIGNILNTDDGAGVHALRLLRDDPPPGAELVEAGTAILDAMPRVEEAEGIVILDAVQAGGAPGQVYILDGQAIEAAPRSASVHGFGLLDAVRLLSPGTPLPPAIIIGVEPASLDYGMELTPAVASAIPLMAEAARSIAERFQPMPQGIPI